MFERVPRRWYVGSIELQRFRARDESVAARDRRLRRHRGARLHCGSLGLVSDGGCTDCQRECRCDCVHPHLFTSYAARPDLTYTCQHKALAVESLQLVKREHHNPTPEPCASRKFGAAQGSKLFLQTNRKGRWACGPCLNLVNQIRCDVHLCASTLRTRKSESQYRQG